MENYMGTRRRRKGMPERPVRRSRLHARQPVAGECIGGQGADDDGDRGRDEIPARRGNRAARHLRHWLWDDVRAVETQDAGHLKMFFNSSGQFHLTFLFSLKKFMKLFIDRRGFK